ncbi:MAG: [2Fe-2S]-binding protein [Gemmatimonadetes bacterium]|nr:[2Fe-2S]-binding protein [Gemmatimonadota bacterium]
MTPPRIGDPAPDFALPAHESGARLFDLREASVVLAFHEPGWNPSRAELVENHRRLASDPSRTVLIAHDDPVAALYGVAHGSAVFVVDPRGRIAWRHIAGIDSLELAAQVATSKEAAFDEPGGWSRRAFVATVLGAAIALTLEPAARRTHALAATSDPVGQSRPVTLMVNGKKITLQLEPRVTLLDALREYAGLTGSKKGCDHGQCGACTVHVGGRRTLSCLTFAVMHEASDITTIEGLAPNGGDTLHPMQAAFIEHDGFQCGYCTSGQIMSACAMLTEPWGHGDDDVREAMSGNICRCGAYPGIVAAVQSQRGAAK